jgi:hypothetical protein
MNQQKRNVFMDVELKNPAQPIPEEEVIQAPPEPVEKPQEEQIFKPTKDLVLQKPEDPKKYARKTNAKREVTPKMKAHLERIRGLAQEAKNKKKQSKMDPAPEEPVHMPVTEPAPVPVVPVVQPTYNSPNIDYDRIINGLWTKQQQEKQRTTELAQYREQIRKEERQKALNESTSLFKQAYNTHQKKQKESLGLRTLKGFTPQHSHPVFNRSQQQIAQPNMGQSDNPFDVCFKR